MSMIKTRSILDKFEQSPTRVNLPVRIKSPQIQLMHKSCKSRESPKTATYRVYTSGYHERKRLKDQYKKIVTMAHSLFLSSQSHQLDINAFQAWNPQMIPPKSIDYITGTDNQETSFKNFIGNNYELKKVIESMNRIELSEGQNRSDNKNNRSTNPYSRNSNNMAHSNISTTINNQAKSKIKMNNQIDALNTIEGRVSPFNSQFETPKGKVMNGKYNNQKYINTIENTPMPMTRMQKEKMAMKMSKENTKLSKSPQPFYKNNAIDNNSNNNKHSNNQKDKQVIHISVFKSSKKQEGNNLFGQGNANSPKTNHRAIPNQLDKIPVAKSIVASSSNSNQNLNQNNSPKSKTKEAKLAKLKDQLSQLKKNQYDSKPNKKINDDDLDQDEKELNRKRAKYNYYKTESNNDSYNNKSYKVLNNYLD